MQLLASLFTGLLHFEKAELNGNDPNTLLYIKEYIQGDTEKVILYLKNGLVLFISEIGNAKFSN